MALILRHLKIWEIAVPDGTWRYFGTAVIAAGETYRGYTCTQKDALIPLVGAVSAPTEIESMTLAWQKVDLDMATEQAMVKYLAQYAPAENDVSHKLAWNMAPAATPEVIGSGADDDVESGLFDEDDDSFAARLRKRKAQRDRELGLVPTMPEPQVTDAMLRRDQRTKPIRLESPSKSGGKFWETWVEKDDHAFKPWRVMVRFGAIGSPGQMREVGRKVSENGAIAYQGDRIRNKSKKGYRRTN